MKLAFPEEEMNKKKVLDDPEDRTVDLEDDAPQKDSKNDRTKLQSSEMAPRRFRRILLALLVFVVAAVILAVVLTQKDSGKEESTIAASSSGLCDPNPCQEGAPLCIETNETIRCMAACEATPDACEEEHEFCLDVDGGQDFECQHPCDEDLNPCESDELCGVKRTGDVKCTDPNPCDPNPCAGVGVCIDEGEGRFKCDH